MKYPKINGTELFGSATQDGFVELAGLDSNNDHKITHQDTAWSELKVWQDSNQDGIAQSGELHTLDELNISALNLTATPAYRLAADNLITATGSFTRNGQSQLAADIKLTVNFALTDSNPNINDIKQIQFGSSLGANDVRCEMERRVA